MIDINYTSKPFDSGVIFNPDPTTNKKVTLVDVKVKGVVAIDTGIVTNSPLVYEDPDYVWLSTDTIASSVAIVDPTPSSRSIDFTDPTAPVLKFVAYAEARKNDDDTGYLSQVYDIAVTLDLGGKKLSITSDFRPFIKPSSVSAQVIEDTENPGTYIPVISFTIDPFTIDAEGFADIDVVMAVPQA